MRIAIGLHAYGVGNTTPEPERHPPIPPPISNSNRTGRDRDIDSDSDRSSIDAAIEQRHACMPALGFALARRSLAQDQLQRRRHAKARLDSTWKSMDPSTALEFNLEKGITSTCESNSTKEENKQKAQRDAHHRTTNGTLRLLPARAPTAAASRACLRRAPAVDVSRH